MSVCLSIQRRKLFSRRPAGRRTPTHAQADAQRETPCRRYLAISDGLLFFHLERVPLDVLHLDGVGDLAARSLLARHDGGRLLLLGGALDRQRALAHRLTRRVLGDASEPTLHETGPRQHSAVSGATAPGIVIQRAVVERPLWSAVYGARVN